MRFSNWNNHYNEYYNMRGLKYKEGRLRLTDSRYDSDSRYICEKRAPCVKGYFGLACDKKCQCHGQKCDPKDLEVTCVYGCQVGWMGTDCSQPKEDADVHYFCVNSQDLGKYAHVRIDTKGVDYENIHALSPKDGQAISWCNNTSIETNKNTSLVTIQILVDNYTDEAIQEGSCVGKISKKGVYEWRFKIQEKANIVSRNDLELEIDCDFATADMLQISGKAAIKRERWFRRSGIKKAIEYPAEEKEHVELVVVDSSTGKIVSERLIGSSVALRINFGQEEKDLATGVIPYNCDASSPDNEHKVRFLDHNSCPLEKFPISAFHKNGTKSLVTKPFPLFGFDGTVKIEFHCSYLLCFSGDPCDMDCKEAPEPTLSFNATRHRRSTRIHGLRTTGSVRLM